MVRTRPRLQLCAVLLILNLAFIWGNSLLPAAQSLSISNWLRDLLGMGSGGSGGNSSHALRKIAHFSEFAGLGIWLRWMFGMLRQKPQEYLGLPLFVGVCAALVDEGIQLFVPGRGPGIADVGIDSLGLIAGILLLSLIQSIAKNIYKNHLEETRS